MRSRVHRPLHDRHVLRQPVGILGIGVDLGPIPPAPRKPSGKSSSRGIPVGHAAQEPLVAVTARHGDVFARQAVEHFASRPMSPAQLLMNSNAGWSLYAAGWIRDHLEGRLVYRVHRQLVRPRAHHHGRLANGLRNSALVTLSKAAGRVVHRPGQHAREGQHHVMIGIVAAPCLGLLHAQPPLRSPARSARCAPCRWAWWQPWKSSIR